MIHYRSRFHEKHIRRIWAPYLSNCFSSDRLSSKKLPAVSYNHKSSAITEAIPQQNLSLQCEEKTVALKKIKLKLKKKES